MNLNPNKLGQSLAEISKLWFIKLRLGASGGYPGGLSVGLQNEMLDVVASINLQFMVLGAIGG